MRNFLLLLTLCLITGLSFGQQSSFDILTSSNQESSAKEQAALTSEWVNQYRLNDIDRIIRFESGSVYSLKSRTKLGLEGAAEYYADMPEYPNFFVIKDSRVEPSVKKVKDERTVISKEEELQNIKRQIENIELKYAYVQNDPEQKALADNDGWFTKMDELLNELKKKKTSLENELNH